MKKSRLRPWGALVLGLSVCGGLVSNAHITTAAPSKQPHNGKKNAGALESVLHQLKLTADQKVQVKDILDNANSLLKALGANTTLTAEAKKAAQKAIRDEANAAIRETLTDEQKVTFDAWLVAQTAKPKLKEDKPKGEKPEDGSGSGSSGKDCKEPKGGKPTKPTTTPTPTTPSPTATPTTPTYGGGSSGNSA